MLKTVEKGEVKHMLNLFVIRLEEWAANASPYGILCGEGERKILEPLCPKLFFNAAWTSVDFEDVGEGCVIVLDLDNGKDAVAKLRKDGRDVVDGIENVLLPDHKQAMSQEGLPGYAGAVSEDICRFTEFVREQVDLEEARAHDIEELAVIVTDAQAIEIVNRAYHCRCPECGVVCTHQSIYAHWQHVYIGFSCDCGGKFLRAHFFRDYEYPLVFLPRQGQAIVSPMPGSDWWGAAAGAESCIQFLRWVVRDDLRRKVLGDYQRPVPQRDDASHLRVLSNRISSLWHTFMDEWVVLWHLMQTQFFQTRSVEAYSAEFPPDTAQFLMNMLSVRAFRENGIGYEQALSEYNEAAQDGMFAFAPVLRDWQTNPMYRQRRAMFRQWFGPLFDDARSLKEEMRAKHWPVLHFYVRPFQEMQWSPPEKVIPEFVNAFFSKYPEGAVILHGNRIDRNAFEKSFWQDILYREGVYDCMDKTLGEQMRYCLAADLGLFHNGGGIPVAMYTGQPFVELFSSGLLRSKAFDLRLKQDNWVQNTPETGRDRDRYTCLVDLVVDDSDWNFYHNPIHVLNEIIRRLDSMGGREALRPRA